MPVRKTGPGVPKEPKLPTLRNQHEGAEPEGGYTQVPLVQPAPKRIPEERPIKPALLKGTVNLRGAVAKDYKNVADLQSEKSTKDLYQKILDATITTTSREILGASAELWEELKSGAAGNLFYGEPENTTKSAKASINQIYSCTIIVEEEKKDKIM